MIRHSVSCDRSEETPFFWIFLFALSLVSNIWIHMKAYTWLLHNRSLARLVCVIPLNLLDLITLIKIFVFLRYSQSHTKHESHCQVLPPLESSHTETGYKNMLLPRRFLWRRKPSVSELSNQSLTPWNWSLMMVSPQSEQLKSRLHSFLTRTDGSQWALWY
jgi:hypothetical protein